MKYVTVLVPADDCILSSVTGTYKVLNGVNRFLHEAGRGMCCLGVRSLLRRGDKAGKYLLLKTTFCITLPFEAGRGM